MSSIHHRGRSPRRDHHSRMDSRDGHESRDRHPHGHTDSRRTEQVGDKDQLTRIRRRRSYSRTPSPRRRSRSRSTSGGPVSRRVRSYSRSSSREPRHRSRSREKHVHKSKKEKRRRSRSPGTSSLDSNSESDHRRHKKKKHRTDEEKERKRKEKKEKKKKKREIGSSSAHWGKYGIISDSDFYDKSQEFRTWLLEERKLNPEVMSKDQERKEFAVFVEDYNTATLPHEKYYHMEVYESRMASLRSGEFVPPSEDMYDPVADMKAHATRHKKAVADQDSYLSREQLMELRKVQNERVEIGRMKRLGMDVKQNMGVRMDGSVFDG